MHSFYLLGAGSAAVVDVLLVLLQGVSSFQCIDLVLICFQFVILITRKKNIIC